MAITSIPGSAGITGKPAVNESDTFASSSNMFTDLFASTGWKKIKKGKVRVCVDNVAVIFDIARIAKKYNSVY